MELNFRGVQFFFQFSFCSPERASFFAFICLFFALLYEDSNVSLVLQGSLKQTFWDKRRLFWFAFFLFSPLKFGTWLLNRGYWLEVRDPKRLGRRWNTETCCSSKKKKYWWPWTVLIFPNHSWCGGEKERQLPPHHTPPSPAEEASGNITNRRQQTF